MNEGKSASRSKAVHVAGSRSELESALGDYCDLADRGIQPEREKFVQRYSPAIQDELAQCLQAFDFIHDVADRPDMGGTSSADAVPFQNATDSGTVFRLGDYRVLNEIGRGGMGVVYEAEQVSLERRVAVKVLPFAGLLDRRQLERFRNEARAAAMLKHPNIVSVLSVGFERGVHFYAMELVDGCSIADVIRQSSVDAGEGNDASSVDRPMRETSPINAMSTAHSRDRHSFFRSVARVGIQAASALQVAHDAGVIHRDIKPANLLLDQDCTLQIADFGLARIQSDQGATMTGDLVGTLRYMSPEQVEESGVAGHRSDIYSLGLTLYELASGKPAFSAASKALLVNDILQGNVQVLRSHCRDIPRDLEMVIHKCLEPNADARYSSAADLEADLDRFLQGKPVVARRVGTLEVFGRWCSRNRSKAALLGLVTLLLVTLAIGGPLVAWRQASIAAIQRHEAYDADMGRAHAHIENGEIDRAVALLRKYLPSEDGDADDYRSFEYFEMVERCRRRLQATEIRLNWPIRALAAAPNGDLAIGQYFGHPVFVDASSGKQTAMTPDFKFKNNPALGIAFTADGRWLLCVSRDHVLRIWNRQSLQIASSIDLGVIPGCMAVSEQGNVVVGVSSDGGDEFPSLESRPILRFKLVRDDSDQPKLQKLPSLTGAIGPIHDVAISSDGRHVVSSNEDGSLRVWDMESGEIVRVFSDFGGPIMTVAFSPDGNRVCGAGGIYDDRWLSGEAHIYDLESSERVGSFHSEGAVLSTKFVSNDELVTGGMDRRLRIWDVPTGKLKSEIRAHSDVIGCLATVPNARLVITGSEDHAVRSWYLDEDAAPDRIADNKALIGTQGLAVSSDGSLLATGGGDGGVRLWNANDGSLECMLGQHQNQVREVNFSPDGRLLASVCSDWPNNERSTELKLFDTETRNEQAFSFDAMGSLDSAAFSPSGNHVAITGGGKLMLWNVAEKKIDAVQDVGRDFRVVFSRDGTLIGTIDRLWRYPSLEPVFVPKQSQDRFMFAGDIHPSNEYFAAADASTHEIVMLSAKDGSEVERLSGHDDDVLHLVFSHDGKRLASASRAGLVILWDVETGREIIRYRDHPFWVWSAEFSSDDAVLVSSSIGRSLSPSIKIRRAVKPSEARRLLLGARP